MRSQAYVSSIYLDDLYLQGDSYEECEQNVTFTVNMLSQLGFVIHQGKSNFIPKQVIDHLGFTLNSLDMCVSLTQERQGKVVDMCKKLLDAKEFKIVEIARLSGTLVSCMLGIEYGLMHYRHIEIQKTKSLQFSKGNYNGIVTELTREAREDVEWWLENYNTNKLVSHGPPNIVTRPTGLMLTCYYYYYYCCCCWFEISFCHF